MPATAPVPAGTTLGTPGEHALGQPFEKRLLVAIPSCSPHTMHYISFFCRLRKGLRCVRACLRSGKYGKSTPPQNPPQQQHYDPRTASATFTALALVYPGLAGRSSPRIRIAMDRDKPMKAERGTTETLHEEPREIQRRPYLAQYV